MKTQRQNGVKPQRTYLDTTGQGGTSPEKPQLSKPQIIVKGKGSSMANKNRLLKKAKRKLINQILALSLIRIAKGLGDTRRERRFWLTYNCQSNITTTGGRSHGEYCGQRCCTICLAIRKARTITNYLPEIETWPDPFFLTLTVKSVKKEQLKYRIDEMVRLMKRIIGKYKKRHQRGKSIKFYGIYSLESNFNPVECTYNPHFHLILPNLEVADTIMIEWRKYWESKKVRIVKNAQYNRRIKKNRVTDLIETVKYGSKIFTEPDLKKKGKIKPSHIYAKALYNILCAMEGHRVFVAFGFPPLGIKKPNPVNTDVNNYEDWEYAAENTDWHNQSNFKKLTQFTPEAELENMLTNNIDTERE